MSLEDSFRQFVEEVQAQGSRPSDLPRLLKEMKVEEVPEQHRDAFLFWKGLSGPSRNLMLDNASGRRLRKRF